MGNSIQFPTTSSRGQSGEAAHHAVASIDVSQIVWLRKSLGRARLATRVAGLQAGVALGPLVFRLTPSLSTVEQLGLALVAAGAIAWAGFRLAAAFGRGNRVAAWILALALLPYGAYALRVVLRPRPDGIDAGTLISLALWIGTTYFIARGLLAARSLFASQASPAARLLTSLAPAWDSADRVDRPKAFANKRRAAMYWFLFLIPCAWLLFGLLGSAGELNRQPGPTDPDEQLGRQLFQLLVAVPVWLLFAFLYRRARRAAVLKATELRRTHERPFVLYLRSFGDDKLKMRARAANGRQWIEAAPRVNFEEVVVDQLFRYGPVVALGHPDERHAPLGAVRDHVPNSEWQGTVDELMGQALAITMVIGTSPGLVWELRRLAEQGRTSRLMLLAPPLAEPAVRTRWTALRDALGPAMPALAAREIDAAHTRALLLPAGDSLLAITAEDRDDWTYEVVLDAAATLVIRGAEAPLGDELHALAGPVLAGVQTARTDRVGRLVRGICLAAALGFAIGMAGVMGSLVTEPSLLLLATCLSTLLLLASTWLASAHWLPEVSWRQRTLISGVMLLQMPAGLVFGVEALASQALALALLFGSYLAYRRDGVDQLHRQREYASSR